MANIPNDPSFAVPLALGVDTLQTFERQWAATARTLTLDAPVDGELETTDDHDWFAIQMTAGTTYWLHLSTSGVLQRDVYGAAMQLRDAQGVVVKQLLPSTKSLDTLAYTASASATYYLDASMPHVAPMKYIVHATIGRADDHGDTPAGASSASVGQAVRGTFEHDRDVDAFTFTLEGGSYYTLTPNNANIAFSLDRAVSVLRVLPDGASEPLKFTYRANTPLLKIEQGGQYAVLLKHVGQSSETAYALQLDKAFADDHANTIASTSVLPIGASATGVIEAFADLDVFQLSLQANHSYTFAAVLPGDAAGASGARFSNLKLVLSDAAGNALSSASSYYPVEHLDFTAPSSGTYYLSYTHDHASHVDVNRYTLRAADITGDIRKPVLALMNRDAIGTTDALLLEADEFLNAKGPAEYLNANGNFQLRDAAGVRLSINAEVFDVGNRSVVSIDPDDKLRPGAVYTLELGSAAVADYAGNYVAPVAYTFTVLGNRQLVAIEGTTSNDVMFSEVGGSVFFGRAGDDTFYGSVFVDTAMYAHKRADYAVSKVAGEITVSGSTEGRDTMYNVDRLQFADKVITFFSDGIDNQAYRMYRAVFNREPDAAGLGFYVKLLETGYTLYTISPFFVASPEFQNLYGSNPGNREFVDRLYQNVLHRAGEAEGVAFWVDLLDRQVLTQSQIVVGFSESPENMWATAALIGNGIEYIPYG